MAIGESAQIVKSISEKSGKSEQEVLGLVEAKKAKFAGLLTDVGAAIMVAKEFGVQSISAPREGTKIKELTAGASNVDVNARVQRIFPEKEFEKNGRKGKLRSLILADGTAEIRATLWNSDAEKFSTMGIAKGDAVKLVNCSVTEWNGQKQLNLNYNSSIEKDADAAPAQAAKPVSISDLDSGMNDVTVAVTIKKIFPSRTFERDGRSGQVLNFIISEGLQEIRATAWNDRVGKIEDIGEGEKIKIEGAYTKEGTFGGIELHLGSYAQITKEGLGND